MSFAARQRFSSQSASAMTGGRVLSQRSYTNFGAMGVGSGFGGQVGMGGMGMSTFGGGGGMAVSGGNSYRMMSTQSSGLGMSMGGGMGGFGAGGAVGVGMANGAGVGFGMAGGAGGGSGMAGGVGRAVGMGGGMLGDGGAMVLVANDKQQLRSLNNRLATYLEKVKHLETVNRELEEKLRAFTANKVHITYDLQAYEASLLPLKEQLLIMINENSRLALAIDNTKLTIDDFRMKYENECALRQTVEADMTGLKNLLKDYEMASIIIEQDYQALAAERTILQATHDAEIQSLRGEMVGTVTVDVKAVESTDLSRVLAELRTEYETVVEKNRRDAESWYNAQVEMKQAEVALVTETTVTGSTEIVESRKTSLTLQTALDSEMFTKVNFEQRLVEVQAQYQAQLASLSRLVGSLEGELVALRESAMQQSQEYQLLLSTKVQLEMEIATYKSLLEGAVSGTTVTAGSSVSAVSAVSASSSSVASSSVSVATVVQMDKQVEEVVEIAAPVEVPVLVEKLEVVDIIEAPVESSLKKQAEVVQIMAQEMNGSTEMSQSSMTTVQSSSTMSTKSSIITSSTTTQQVMTGVTEVDVGLTTMTLGMASMPEMPGMAPSP